MNFILMSSNYRYTKFLAKFSSQAKEVLNLVSGVEPTLFLLRPIIDRRELKLRESAVKKFLSKFKPGGMPLSNGRQGIRLHGFVDHGFKYNKISYFKDVNESVAFLIEQIKLANRMAKLAGVNDSIYPSLLTIHLGKSIGNQREEIGKCVRILNKMAPLCQEYKTIINLETMPSEKNDYELGSNLEDLAEIFSSLKDKENFGITFDFSHSLINYRGDYEKIKERLQSLNLLQYIKHLHVTVPNVKYHKRPLPWLRNYGNIFVEEFINLTTYQPDNHAGLKTFFKNNEAEKEKYLDLLKFILKNSQVLAEKYRVINLEFGPKIWGTDKGAAPDDLLYSLEFLRKELAGL